MLKERESTGSEQTAHAVLHHSELQKSRRFFQMGFYVLAVLCALLVFYNHKLNSKPPVVKGYVVFMSANKQFISAVPVSSINFPSSEAQLKNDITRYVRTRESFRDEGMIGMTYWVNDISWMSTKGVFNQFRREITASNSMVHKFGKEGYRNARINAISFVRNPKGKPIEALVDFTVNGVDKNQVPLATRHYRATLTWAYLGKPRGYEASINNWSGFTVTHYEVSDEV